MRARARLLLLLPFTALLGVFFAAPLLLMVAISVSRQSFGELQWTFTLHHYARFFSDAYYIGVLWDTLVLGALVTVIALLLGYPLAYHLARTRSRWKPFLLVAVLSPLLVGIVIRCYGWMILLADRGLINATRSEEHTSELQSRGHLVCRLLLEKKKKHIQHHTLVYTPNMSSLQL